MLFRSDIPLLTSVGNPRAINPDTKLQIKAHMDSWPIHDFRKARRFSAVMGPLLARIFSAITYLKPERRQH